MIDLFLISLSLSIVSKFHYDSWLNFSDLFFLLNGIWIFIYIVFLDVTFFDPQLFSTRIQRLLKELFYYVSVGAIFIVLFNWDDISRTMFLGSSLCFLILKIPVTLLNASLIARRKDAASDRNILIIGAGRVGGAIQAFYRLNPSQGNVIGFLDDNKQRSEKFNVIGVLADFQKVFDRSPFSQVIITIDLSKEKLIKSLVNIAEYNGVRPSIVANYYSLFHRNFELKNYAGIPIVNIREVPLDNYIPRLWKRVFDLAFSSFALVITFPIFLILSIAIKFESKGPVFYKPIRIGKRGNQILVYKFRSMRNSDSPLDGKRSTTINDERITKVGKFIRKYSLDELPQFINVLKGDMSVVGPRPHRLDLDKRFQQIVPTYMVRQYIKPGITGWAQVNGWRGPTETKYQYIARTLHDLWYIEHWSFALDIYIVLLTVFGKKTRTNAF